MNTNQARIIITGFFFVFIILSGIWLSRSGKPYNNLIFNIHKLIGLAAGAFLIYVVYRSQQVSPLSSIQVTALVITVIIFISGVIAGGLLSVFASGQLSNASQAVRSFVSLSHKVFPFLAILTTALTLYLLYRT